MRRLAISVLLVVAACGHDERPKSPSARDRAQRAAIPVLPPQWLVADPDGHSPSFAVVLAEGQLGAAIGPARVVMGRGEPKLASDEPKDPFAGVAKIPKRLGGGFLFWTKDDVYRADAFTSALQPIAHFPAAVDTVSFAPKFLLVHTENGERWALGLDGASRGARVPIDPLGVVDVEGLDDGRAIAMNDQGAIFTSMDGGVHWADATSHLKTSPQQVSVIDDDVWLVESGGGNVGTQGAHRLESDGRLAYFDTAPTPKAIEVRATDVRWRGPEKPLRMAFRSGAAVDESTAIVAANGDIVKIDVLTGEIVATLPGHLPPTATCEAIPVPNDVLFACQAPAGHGAAVGPFVVSHTLGSEAPVIEQSFASSGRIFASDDGGVAFEGSCAGGNNPSNLPAVCVRQPSGTWQELDLALFANDGGAAAPTVARFVPRADGRAVAIVLDPAPAILDLRTGAATRIAAEARDLVEHRGAAMGHRVRAIASHYFHTLVVDGSWSFVGTNTIRAWDRFEHVFEIAEDGRVTRSPWELEIVSAGAYGIGKSKDGRLYQSTDHGATFTEVAAPPSGAAAIDFRGCSTAGCDLGGFYRVGWTAEPPRPRTPSIVVRPPPEIRREAPIQIACRALGQPQPKILPRTDRSPDDLGFGASRLTIPTNDDWQTVREPAARIFPNPVHPPSSDVETDTSLRGLLSGFGTDSGNGDIITVLGPDKSALRLKRAAAFTAPFDPSGAVRRGTIATSDIVAAARAAGLSQDEILAGDPTMVSSVVPVTPLDPLAPSDLVGQTPNGQQGLVVAFRAGKGGADAWRTRVSMAASPREATIVSGAAISADEIAVLEVESSGVGHVYKTSGAGTVDLYDLSPTLADTEYYPANPDAVAIGPKNEIGVLRTPSGSDPASARDPAFVFQPATPPLRLAPWSTLKLASDAECKRDPGWRATVHLVSPWLRVASASLRVMEGPMVARVKWSAERVCLEAFEVRLPGVDLRIKNPAGGLDTEPFGTWLVGLIGKPFARVGIGEGIEWRQPLECTFP